MISKTKIKRLKKQLEGKSKQPVADKTGKSVTWVSDVLSCKYYDEEVIKACVDYRDELKKESIELAARI